MTVSRNPTADDLDRMMDLARMADEPLIPELQGWVEEGEWGPMLRHPLVYSVPLLLPGQANLAFRRKTGLIAEAVEEEDWSTVIWLHERPYRLKALIDYVTGRYDGTGEVIPLNAGTDRKTLDLVADVWVDSENITQVNDDWQALLDDGAAGFWLGTDDERAEFDALPDPIPAYRGGTSGDWSWSTERSVAEFFSRRSGHPVREALIPKADVFGYFTRRSEYELLVRLTPERMPLVYPDQFPETEGQ